MIEIIHGFDGKLVTGGSGFVGSALIQHLLQNDRGQIVQAARHVNTFSLPRVRHVLIGDITEQTNWYDALQRIDTVIHCAARVHVTKEEAANPLDEFRRVNVEGTLRLARQAADAGVRRFVFVSSIKVNGEYSLPGHPFTADQPWAPGDPYSVSKCEGEAGLRMLSKATGMEVVIIRPPLVYGPGVKANFLAMMRWLWRGVPLPLGCITENRRSFVFLDNLVDLIVTCIDHPAAANQTFLVSDDEDLSTADLLRRMGAALGVPVRLLPVPGRIITSGAKMIGRSDIALRLCGSLQVDIGKTKELLGWSPPVRVDEGLRRTAESWLKLESKLRVGGEVRGGGA